MDAQCFKRLWQVTVAGQNSNAKSQTRLDLYRILSPEQGLVVIQCLFLVLERYGMLNAPRHCVKVPSNRFGGEVALGELKADLGCR